MAIASRRFVSALGHQEQIDQIFLASEKQLRPNRNGNLYLQVDLSDRSGTVNARMWNASENDYRAFENGDYVRVEGTTQLFQGTIQLIATGIRRAMENEVDTEDFMTLGSRQIDQLVVRLTAHLRKIKNPQLRGLAECFLMDEDFMRKFGRAPAGVKNHHAYVGGLTCASGSTGCIRPSIPIC
jgi:3'-5' exoribonuclease